MSKKLTTLIILAILASLALGYALNYILQSTPVFAQDHQNVATQIRIVDVTKSAALSLRYEGSGSFLPFLDMAGQFPPGHTYRSSKWGFYLNGDLEAYMKVSGPGVDGKTYGVEVSKCAWDELKIYLPGGVPIDFPAVTAVGQSQMGYVSWEFIP